MVVAVFPVFTMVLLVILASVVLAVLVVLVLFVMLAVLLMVLVMLVTVVLSVFLVVLLQLDIVLVKDLGNVRSHIRLKHGAHASTENGPEVRVDLVGRVRHRMLQSVRMPCCGTGVADLAVDDGSEVHKSQERQYRPEYQSAGQLQLTLFRRCPHIGLARLLRGSGRLLRHQRLLDVLHLDSRTVRSTRKHERASLRCAPLGGASGESLRSLGHLRHGTRR